MARSWSATTSRKTPIPIGGISPPFTIQSMITDGMTPSTHAGIRVGRFPLVGGGMIPSTTAHLGVTVHTVIERRLDTIMDMAIPATDL